MSGYWHHTDSTATDIASAGVFVGKFDDPVDEGNIALLLAGDETSVVEGEQGQLLGMLRRAVEIVESNGEPPATWPLNAADRVMFTHWQHEVANGDTILGFRDWVAHVDEMEG